MSHIFEESNINTFRQPPSFRHSIHRIHAGGKTEVQLEFQVEYFPAINERSMRKYYF